MTFPWLQTVLHITPVFSCPDWRHQQSVKCYVSSKLWIWNAPSFEKQRETLLYWTKSAPQLVHENLQIPIETAACLTKPWLKEPGVWHEFRVKEKSKSTAHHGTTPGTETVKQKSSFIHSLVNIFALSPVKVPPVGVQTSKCLADVKGHDGHPGKRREEEELKKNGTKGTKWFGNYFYWAN